MGIEEIMRKKKVPFNLTNEEKEKLEKTIEKIKNVTVLRRFLIFSLSRLTMNTRQSVKFLAQRPY